MMPIASGVRTKSKMEAMDEVIERFRCSHDHVGIRARRVGGGGIQYCNQCQRCGARVGQAIARSSIAGNPPSFDERLLETWESQRRMAHEKLDQDYASAFWDDYSLYLNSPEWAERRRLVLDRAGGLCEGCRKAKPVHVHHLTYQHAGNELLFELVALCEPCHHVCHEHMTGNQ